MVIKALNYRENFPKGSWKSVQIIDIFELQRFELRKVNYTSFLRKFNGDFKFVHIMEIFELRRVELERVNCIFALGTEKIVRISERLNYKDSN